jgi:hypothetical protein
MMHGDHDIDIDIDIMMSHDGTAHAMACGLRICGMRTLHIEGRSLHSPVMGAN